MGMVSKLLAVHQSTGLILAKDQGGERLHLHAAVRAGELERITRGVYVRKGERSDYELFRLRAAAVGLTHGDSVVTGPAAASLLGLAYLHRRHQRVDLLTPYVSGTQRGRHVTRRRASPDVPRETVNGIRVTTAQRTAIEASLMHGVRDGLVIAESALWSGRCTSEELGRELRAAANRKGRASASTVVDVAGDRSQSAGETLTSWCLRLAGLEGFVQQVHIIDDEGNWVATVDFFHPELGFAIEFDGDVKTSGQYGDPTRVARDQLRRHDSLANLGIFVLRLKWTDVVDGRVVAKLREIFQQRAGMGRFFRGTCRPATREELRRGINRSA